MTSVDATFADFKLIKTRGQAQLVLEVPIEQADAALKALGGVPIPGAERWVTLRPHGEKDEASPPSSTGSEHRVPDPKVGGSSPSADATPRERRPFSSLPRSQQAAMLCDDERFRAWIDQQKWPADVRRHADEVWGREEKPNKWFGVFVCHECMTSSRRHFDHDPEAAKRWDFMHARYRRETGLDPEPRG